MAFPWTVRAAGSLGHQLFDVGEVISVEELEECFEGVRVTVIDHDLLRDRLLHASGQLRLKDFRSGAQELRVRMKHFVLDDDPDITTGAFLQER